MRCWKHGKAQLAVLTAGPRMIHCKARVSFCRGLLFTLQAAKSSSLMAQWGSLPKDLARWDFSYECYMAWLINYKFALVHDYSAIPKIHASNTTSGDAKFSCSWHAREVIISKGEKHHKKKNSIIAKCIFASKNINKITQVSKEKSPLLIVVYWSIN